MALATSFVATLITQDLRQRDICNDAAIPTRPRADEAFETNYKTHNGNMRLALSIRPGALYAGGRADAQPMIFVAWY
jgi:hypothetical protein